MGKWFTRKEVVLHTLVDTPEAPIKPSWAFIIAKPWRFVAFGLGSGLLPKAPGTWGSLAALPFFLLLHQLPIYAYWVGLVFAFIAGIWICGKTSADLGVEDHSGIVWDEFVGLWLSLACVPPGWGWLLVGFLLFRLFDTVKPWPISWFDKHLHGGLGVMFDDILAGIAALVSLQILEYIW